MINNRLLRKWSSRVEKKNKFKRIGFTKIGVWYVSVGSNIFEVRFGTGTHWVVNVFISNLKIVKKFVHGILKDNF